MYQNIHIETIGDEAFICDENYTIVACNSAFKNKEDLKNIEIIGMKCYEAIFKINTPCADCTLHQKKQTYRFHEWKDPFSEKYYNVLRLPMEDSKTGKIFFLFIASDITETKFADRKLMETMHSQTEAMLKFSREMRTPFTAIKGGLDLFINNYNQVLTINQKSMLDSIRKNVNQLLKITNNIFEFHNLDSDSALFSYQLWNINDTIRQAAETMKPIIWAKGLELQLNLDNQVPEILFDKDKIMQVITNILNNSIKFTNYGDISISSQLTNRFVQVTITDTGIGIKDIDQLLIVSSFLEFTSPEYRLQNTGLGLAICYKIIEKHNGRIWIESELNKGTSVHFVIPTEML